MLVGHSQAAMMRLKYLHHYCNLTLTLFLSWILNCILYFVSFVFCIVLRLKYLHHYCSLIWPLSDPRVLHCQMGVYCAAIQYIALCGIALKDLRILRGNAIHCPNVSVSHS